MSEYDDIVNCFREYDKAIQELIKRGGEMVIITNIKANSKLGKKMLNPLDATDEELIDERMD